MGRGPFVATSRMGYSSGAEGRIRMDLVNKTRASWARCVGRFCFLSQEAAPKKHPPLQARLRIIGFSVVPSSRSSIGFTVFAALKCSEKGELESSSSLGPLPPPKRRRKKGELDSSSPPGCPDRAAETVN